ncbi:hypothetical protein OG762_41580 [Streptomyces sp. NBC_01136]|uniref:hypothetical protein n=1 Tax=unclassified Streptomyces TaxID=2593676 RepID=UPI003248E364|nr:hypothetical protein OG762_41580 [Streptomyces sp. NBC_01136]
MSPARWKRSTHRTSSSSWHGYEVETRWSQVEIEHIKGPDVLRNGTTDPRRVDEPAGLLGRRGLKYSLELYDGDGSLVREIQA